MIYEEDKTLRLSLENAKDETKEELGLTKSLLTPRHSIKYTVIYLILFGNTSRLKSNFNPSDDYWKIFFFSILEDLFYGGHAVTNIKDKDNLTKIRNNIIFDLANEFPDLVLKR